MRFREQLAADLVVAPFVSNALSARLAEAAGFKTLYVGGGGLGFEKCITEANLTAQDFAEVAMEIRTVSRLPLIMDAAGGFGDPMHLVRTIGLAEAAGYAAIELEDVELPKRAHHHIGIDYPVEAEFMVHKLREAVAVRQTDLAIIARTGVTKVTIDEALRRGEMYVKAGADILWVQTLVPEQLRKIGETFDVPLMHCVAPGSFAEMGITRDELKSLGFRLLVDASTPLLAVHRALKQCYEAMAADAPDPLLGDGAMAEAGELLKSIDLERLLDIERRTVGA